MEIKWYRQYLEDLIKEAYQNSDGSNAAVSRYLWSLKEPGRFSSHRDEKKIALGDARKAFDEHRHWPPSIVLSHLGIEDKELISKLTSR